MTAELDALRARLAYTRERFSQTVTEWAAADDAGDVRAAARASARMRYWEARRYAAFEAVHPALSVPLDDLPMVDWSTRLDYRNTPTWVPRRGLCVHVGGGVFVTVCAECDYAMRSRGAAPVYGTVGPHEVAEHGALVAGINLALLP